MTTPTTPTWIEIAHSWIVAATPVLSAADKAWIDEHDLDYVYYSPYRPLDFICGQVGSDIQIADATQEGTAFLYTAEPVPTDRIEAWQLIPISDAAWKPLCSWQIGDPAALCNNDPWFPTQATAEVAAMTQSSDTAIVAVYDMRGDSGEGEIVAVALGGRVYR